MKNKEIEELLNKLEYASECDDFIIEIRKDRAKALLSYIEQLENNRDKAIEYIDNNSHYYSTDTGEEGFVIDTETEEEFCNTLENILKGDSDD